MIHESKFSVAANLILYSLLLFPFLILPEALFSQSKPDVEKRPNVIFILLDDTGFSDIGSYGSEISTPHIDQLAYEGLRFNHAESRAICSPSRAALLTGRNNQSVGMMDLAGYDEGGYSHSLGYVTPKAGTIAEVLRLNGYRTVMTGKWHLVPMSQMWNSEEDKASTQENWPLQKGFDEFYGWLSGWTDQYNPKGIGQRMIEGNRPAREMNPGGAHVSVQIVNKAIDYLEAGFEQNQGRPQFLYLSFGATHAPIQVPKQYIDRYEGMYDIGWDRLREERFARQRRIGIIPENAVLTDRHPEDPKWEGLSEIEKSVYAEFMETYAGFMEHTDVQIGKLIDYLKQTGEYENTIIILTSDNGAAPEAGVEGNFAHPYGGTMSVEEMFRDMDKLGTEQSQPLYQRPWARVGSTPFKKYKLWPHAGGVRVPFIVSWPRKILDEGAIRPQYVEMIDVAPTVMDVLQIETPEEIDGIPQMPVHGKSFADLFSNQDAKTRSTQFYLMRGSRAIYHEGWKAIAFHERGTPFEEDRWELYDTEKDFSESNDLAEEQPEKLEQLKALWWSEAERYGALPLVEFQPPWLNED